ncbi:MAG: 16S rRNA (uracil(1498)-N(3))-methyltransferase [Acidobacteria bacterium]|nr:16S rRNA (uracil(1498)-N(3))-methyltransferase [Acidobacteriota bacterium]
MRPRFLARGPFVAGSIVELDDDELHHAARVSRVREGELVEVIDGKGATAGAVVRTVTKSAVSIEILEPSLTPRESPLAIELAQALIQPEKFELVLQKACELGVSRVTPLISDRIDTRPERIAGRTARWQRILIEATKQSGRALVPELAAPESFRSVLDRDCARVLFDADAAETRTVGSQPRRLVVLIGPEGGWSEAETALAMEHGCEIRRLGPRRLRAETAAIAALVVAGSLWGDLRQHD